MIASHDPAKPKAHGSPRILDAAGAVPAGDAAEQARLRDLAWEMVEVEAKPAPAWSLTWPSRAWLAARRWAVAPLAYASADEDALCALLRRRGLRELLGTCVDPRLTDPPDVVWRFPNEEDDEGVPLNNFLVAHSGWLRLAFDEARSFGLHVEEEADVYILMGPPDLIREATGGDPAAANARFLEEGAAMERSLGYPPGSVTAVADRYAPFLLRA